MMHYNVPDTCIVGLTGGVNDRDWLQCIRPSTLSPVRDVYLCDFFVSVYLWHRRMYIDIYE